MMFIVISFNAFLGHIDIVRFLVNKSADVNAKDINEKTTLHYMTIQGV